MKHAYQDSVALVQLDGKSRQPLHRQVYASMRQAMLDGRLKAGDKIASSRRLATILGISRIPIVVAYDQLFAEGYIETKRGSGTYVAASIPDVSFGAVRNGQPSDKAKPSTAATSEAHNWRPSDLLKPFRVSLPALQEFPHEHWSRLVSKHARRQSIHAMAYGDPMGHKPLRQEIAQYLTAVRGLRCDWNQVLIVTGSQQALQLCASVLLKPGDSVWMEDPGYPGARDALLRAHAKITPVPVDEEGLQVSIGKTKCPSAALCYVTPSHQYPLGMTLSASRRMELLEWAHTKRRWVIEDDYDSEFRYTGQPIASLQSLAPDRVIYIGTFSKVMFPALRVGYVVLPTSLVESFRAARDASDIFSATLYQSVLAEFIRDGRFSSHLRRMRAIYMTRRADLIELLKPFESYGCRILSAPAGLHLVLDLPPGWRDSAIVELAAKEGVIAAPVSECCLKSKKNGLILGYGGTTKEQMRPAAATLLDMCRSHSDPQ